MVLPRLAALADLGVSVWLDDLSRERLTSGGLQRLVDEYGVCGVTTNPSIFQAAMARGDAYAGQLRELASGGAGADEAVLAMTTRDVGDACDLFAPVHARTAGVDGRVSIEVDPRLARDAEATLTQARELRAAVGRDNVLIKIPATLEGLPAITRALAEGISVNVTLIFGLERYRAVMNAFLVGLEQARENGHDLSGIHSVASFFVSRVDTEVDRRLDALRGPDARRARELRGGAGVANARLAHRAHGEVFSSTRWQTLAEAGARPQRPLWASTGTKDPTFADTKYVTELVAPGTVNTMPEATLRATGDHAEILGDTVTGSYPDAAAHLDELEGLGISYTEVTALLEQEGLEKFETAWQRLLADVSTELEKAGR